MERNKGLNIMKKKYIIIDQVDFGINPLFIKYSIILLYRHTTSVARPSVANRKLI